MPQTGLFVVIASHDMRAVVPTVVELSRAGEALGHPTRFFVSEASNIPRGRNLILQQLRRKFPELSALPVLWVDSDIIIPAGQSHAIADAIRWSEAHRAPVVANYPMADGRSVLIAERETGAHYTEDELRRLPDFAEVGMAGFGFLYIEQPLSYAFHADYIGEDIHFWMDHPDVRPHLAKHIRLQHRKTVVLEQWWDTESEAASPEPAKSSFGGAIVQPLSKPPIPAAPGSKRLWIPQDAKI